MDPATKHSYFVSVPNMVDDMGLDPYAFRLYVHLKRRAQEDGECFESTPNLAALCQMSAGRVTKAKQDLVARGLVVVSARPNRHGGKPNHHITIADIWGDNAALYASSPGERANTPISPGELASSPGELASSPGELASSPGEIKKNPLRRTHEEEPMKKGRAKAPGRIPSEKPGKLFPPDSEPYRLADLLRQRVLARYPRARVPEGDSAPFQRWCYFVDLLVRRDGHPVAEVEQVLEWSQRDTFWRQNILSTDSLHKQYDRLYAKATEEPRGGHHGNQSARRPTSVSASTTGEPAGHIADDLGISREEYERRKSAGEYGKY